MTPTLLRDMFSGADGRGDFGTIRLLRYPGSPELSPEEREGIDSELAGKGEGAFDAALNKAQARRMAVAAQDGIARAVVPAHTPVDGDLVFGVSTGALTLTNPAEGVLQLGHAAAVCVARAIARAVYSAHAADDDLFPTWKERFGNR